MQTPVAEGFSWSRLHMKVALAVIALTAAADLMYIAIHGFLRDLVARGILTRDSGAPVERASADAITVWLRGLLDVFDPAWMAWAIAIGAPAACMFLVAQRASRLRALGGEGIVETLGARRADDDTQGPALVLRECVQAAAAARGIAAPPVFVLDLPDRVSAAMFGSTPQNAVLAFSSGALTRLDPVALGALAAWQLGALDAGRLDRDTRIAALLYPLTLPWMLGDRLLELELWIKERYDAFSDAIESNPAGRIGNFPVPMYFALQLSLRMTLTTLRRMVRLAGFPGLAMARLIVRESLRSEIGARDTAIAQQPGKRDALAAALDAASRTDETDDDLAEELVRVQPFAVEFAHMFFTEPAAVPQGARLQSLAQRLTSHPDPMDRLAAVAPEFDRDRYERSAAANAARAATPAFARHAELPLAPLPAAEHADAPAHAPAAVAPAGYEFPDPREEMQRGEFFLRFDRALLDRLDTPHRASEALLVAGCTSLADDAAARALAGRIRDTPLGVLADLQRTSGKLSHRERRWLNERALVSLRNAASTEKADHLATHRALIESDRRITLEEMLDWLTVARALDALPDAAASAASPLQDLELLIGVFAHTGAANPQAAASAFARGRDAAGIPALTLPERSQLSATGIEQTLLRTARALPAQRLLAIKACLATARAGGPLREDREETLRRLCAIFDCAASVLRPVAAMPAQRSAAPAVTLTPAKVTAASAYASPYDSALQADIADEADPLSAEEADGLPLVMACLRCGESAQLMRKRISAAEAITDWLIPGIAALLAGALLSYLCSDMYCGPVGWTSVIAISLCVLVFTASLLGTSTPIAGLELSRKTQIALLCVLYGLLALGHLYMGASFGVWIADITSFGGILAYLMTRKPSGRRLFYKCTECGANSPPPGSLVNAEHLPTATSR